MKLYILVFLSLLFFIYSVSSEGDFLILSEYQKDAYMGIAVSDAGDVNGDGYSDVIIGIPGYDDKKVDEGRVHIYYGSSTGLSEEPDWIGEQGRKDAYFGWTVSSAGDVNGDGYSDVIIGAPGFNRDDGRVYVYHGSPDGLSDGVQWTAGPDQKGVYFGVSVSSAGDVNGDGYSDVVVGADMYDNGQIDEGRAFVFLGSPSGLSQEPVWSAEGGQNYSFFGSSVSGAGDVNNDGYSDIIIGSNAYDNGQINEGRVYIYYGGPDGPSKKANCILESNKAYSYFGYSVSSAGDVNGDGYSDVIIGAHFYIVGSEYYEDGAKDEGRVFVYYGNSSGLYSLNRWYGDMGQPYSGFGVSVSSAGDVNDDGYHDVIIGSYRYDNGEIDEGSAFVYYGGNQGISSKPDFAVESNQSNSFFGVSVSSAGDVNGDGHSDILVGAYRYNSSNGNGGSAFLYYGDKIE